MRHKSVLFLAISLLAMGITFRTAAQDAGTETFEHRVMTAKPDKDSKRQAKSLISDGWMVRSTDLPLDMQIMQSVMYETETMPKAIMGSNDRFIVVNSRQSAKNLDSALALARNKALAEIASLISSEIESIVRTRISNSTAEGKALSEDEIKNTIEMTTSSTLRGAKTIMLIYRDTGDGKVEVMIKMFYDKTSMAGCEITPE